MPKEAPSTSLAYEDVFHDRGDFRHLAFGKLNDQELDALPFGAILLSPDGTVLRFNRTEQELTGRRPENVVGRNFFTEVAPCTNVQAFAGRFREGIAAKVLHAVFPYRFDFKMKPRNVTVSLFYDAETDKAWVFVRDLGE